MRRIAAILLAFLLTGSLILFCVTFAGRQVIAPAMADGGVQVKESVFRGEEQLVRDRVTELAELYGFEAEPVLATISGETLRELNRQSAEWWHTLLLDGEAGQELRWNIRETEQALLSDPKLSALEDRERADYLASSAAEDISSSVVRIVLPMRQQTIRLGLRVAGRRVDVPNLVSFFLGVPWAALALCALLSGLVMLLEGGKFTGSLRYIGAALGAAAIVTAALLVLFLNAGILPMIREASASLTVQYRSVESETAVRLGILAAVMAAGCVLCLAGKRAGHRKGRRTA